MRVFGLILVGLIIIVLVYSAVRWLASEISFEGFWLRQERTSTSTESVPTEKTRGTSQKTEKRVIDIPLGFLASELSPDFGKVEISSLRRPSSSGTGGGFTLRTTSALDDFLDITNWKIRSNNKREIAIRGGNSFLPPAPDHVRYRH